MQDSLGQFLILRSAFASLEISQMFWKMFQMRDTHYVCEQVYVRFIRAYSTIIILACEYIVLSMQINW